MSSIYGIGLKGIKQGLSSAADNADKLSRSFEPPSSNSPSLAPSDSDGTDAIIGLKLAEHQVKSSAAVIKVAKELDDSVLDILA